MACALQVGCPMRCTFCATGKGGFARNLAAHEIVDQVLTVQEQFGQRVSNIGTPPTAAGIPVFCKLASFLVAFCPERLLWHFAHGCMGMQCSWAWVSRC